MQARHAERTPVTGDHSMRMLTSLRRAAARRRTEAGASAVMLAVFVAALAMPLGAIGVDVARWYVEIERVQAAADAAATAGVTFMPDDFASARARAIEIAGRNGFPNSGDTYVQVEPGEKPTQLKVTVGSSVENNFGRYFGMDDSTMSRSATADFNGPAPMGSPCNTLGNEPPGTPARGPVGSVISAPPYAQCSSNPQFWASAAGPNVLKTQGEQFGTRRCAGNEDGCSPLKLNEEFDPQGYFYLVRVGQAAVNNPITLQLFDPAYVATRSRCDGSPVGTAVNNNNWNDYANTDAVARYRRTPTNGAPNVFCTGDDPNSGWFHGSEQATVTSFGLRAPIDTLQPKQAPAVPGCARQYPGYDLNAVTPPMLRKGNSQYNDRLARVFRQWVSLCTFTPTAPGDYYLQVRTNVALGGVDDGNGGQIGNNAVYTQTGDDTNVNGTGANRFGIRAVSAVGQAVSVAAWERMPIFANSDSASTVFNLVRVIPAAANKTLVFGFFDVGEGASTGTLTVLPPVDSNLSSNITGCRGTGKVTGALPNCRITGINTANGWNGKSQQIRVPIPSTYTCEVSSPGGCWFRVGVDFGSGAVTDATTWTAKIEGEPVRLVE